MRYWLEIVARDAHGEVVTAARNKLGGTAGLSIWLPPSDKPIHVELVEIDPETGRMRR